MKVFVTGASGFVGSAVVKELIAAGHMVTGLARSEASAQALKNAGASVLHGDLEDIASLRKGAADSDGVIHTAFVHKFDQFEKSCLLDRSAIETLGKELLGSQRHLVVTSGTALLANGEMGTEDRKPTSAHNPRINSELISWELAEKGLNISVVRLAPSVHGDGDYGFVPMLAAMAKEKGASVYIGDGNNRWPGVPRADAANLFRLALEKGQRGRAYHGASEEGVPFRKIAEVIGKQLGVPVLSKSLEDAKAYLGWMAMFAGVDNPISSKFTRESLGWAPAGPDLLTDIDRRSYFGK